MLPLFESAKRRLADLGVAWQDATPFPTTTDKLGTFDGRAWRDWIRSVESTDAEGVQALPGRVAAVGDHGRRAAEGACERITEDGSNPWNLMLDSDTQGVAGMCDIPNTILEKIRTCSMFLADLTFVGKADEDSGGQQMPNSNVLFELGFAARCLGFDALVGVVNEAYGNIEGQVFDIKRRSSLSYCVQEDADSPTVAKQQERLGRQLEEVFRVTLETVVAPRMAQAGRDRDQEFKSLQSDFAGRVRQGRFHDYSGLPAALLTIQTSAAKKLGYDDLYEQVRPARRNVRSSEEAIY